MFTTLFYFIIILLFLMPDDVARLKEDISLCASMLQGRIGLDPKQILRGTFLARAVLYH